MYNPIDRQINIQNNFFLFIQKYNKVFITYK